LRLKMMWTWTHTSFQLLWSCWREFWWVGIQLMNELQFLHKGRCWILEYEIFLDIVEWCWSGTTTANATGSTYNANGTTGWELALVTYPTNNTSVATNSKFVRALHLICIMPCPSHWLLTILSFCCFLLGSSAVYQYCPVCAKCRARIATGFELHTLWYPSLEHCSMLLSKSKALSVMSMFNCQLWSFSSA
jgi:hypothetical protein